MGHYSVEVRTGLFTGPHNIHTWLYITHPDGSAEAWGFYPSSLDYLVYPFTTPGDVKPENISDSYSASTGKIPISDSEYNSLVSYIAEMKKTHPTYSLLALPNSMQCSMWAISTLQHVGILPLVISPKITPEFIPILDTMIWNPIIQTAGFDLSDFFKNLSSLIDSLLSFFHTAETTRSPLVLDLNGDGVITTSQSGGVHFDNDGNGFSELTGWIDSNDGLLVIDKNNNGKIDNGNELFGNNTLLADGSTATNGFLALATYDTNKDGKIDASDTQFFRPKSMERFKL